MKVKMLTITLAMAVCLPIYTTMSHEGSHEVAEEVPKVGPHGGKVTMLTHHFAELVYLNDKVTIYILEKDAQHIAKDASNVSTSIEYKGKKKKLKLKKDKKSHAYSADLSLPKSVRKAHVYIQCELDGKKEQGRVLIEPHH